ncbi:MAG: site-specific integrase [Actinobacteria bacterium]|nr:site-specific integrase [Actinomycetota bacterium]
MPSGKAITVSAWAASYEELALSGVRSRGVTERIALHLHRFAEYLSATYGHERLSSVVRCDVVGWRDVLVSSGLGSSTVNNHLASLSGFCGWVVVRAPDALSGGDPTSGVRTLALAALEPRALSPGQVRSLKSVVDRLERLHARKGRRAAPGGERHLTRGRCAIARSSMCCCQRAAARGACDARPRPGQPEGPQPPAGNQAGAPGGRGRQGRDDSHGVSVRQLERPGDADGPASALFLSAASIASRRPGGRLSPRAVNSILQRIGRWHDAEHSDPARWVSPLRPHDLRHTFAFALAETTGKDAYELERRLGHRSQRYIARYTNPPEDVAAAYVEAM